MRYFWQHKTDTILDYGATRYKSNNHALDGQRDSAQAINDMIDDVGVAVLPAFGSFYLNKETTFYRAKDSLVSLGQGNKNVNLITDKPIKMFRPIHNRQDIRGFTAYFFGEKGGAVVYAGGKHKGGLDIHKNGKEYHHWYNRTRLLDSTFDFDVQGLNNNVTPIELDYTKEEMGGAGWYSHAYYTKIRGSYNNVDLGLKIHKRPNAKATKDVMISRQSMNTFDIDVNIEFALKFADIRDINFSKIKIIGGVNKLLDKETFYIEGSQLHCDIFLYDLKEGQEKGNYHVKDLDLSGYWDLLPYPIKTQVNLNDSTIKRMPKS